MPIKISGVQLGNISGGPSSINLSDLHDVSIVSPQTGQYLRYNAGISEWQNAYIETDVFDYLDGALSGTQGVSITATPGPNTIAIGLGAITPTSVAASGTVTGSNLSGSNTGDQTITLTGDVTGSGTSSFAATLATVNSSPQTDQFRKITVNGKGLVTATSAVTDVEITTALGYTPVDIAGDTMTGYLILNGDPVTALGAVTKQYADNIASGLNAKAACITATTTALPASTYNNGAGGVGATLTANANGAIGSVGGYAIAVTDRVLVKNQSTQLQNGIYVVTQLGDGSNPWILTRSSDFDDSPDGEVTTGAFTFIQDGTLAGTQWVLTTTGSITIGSSNIVFSQLSGPGTYSAGTGIDITGTVISNTGVLSNIAGTGIQVSGATGNVTITNNGVLSLTNANGVTLSGSTGAITVGLGAITPTSVSASGTISGSNFSGSSSGTNTGDQTITLTGDVTGSGTGSFATTLSTTGVTPGSYTAANITITADGRITAAANGSGGGGGTVTSVAITGNDGISVGGSPITTSGTITLDLGNITPDSVAAVGTVTGSNLSGTNTGDQTITLTGDITGSGTGSFATTLATVNSNVGTFASVTVNGKGLVTAAANLSGDATTSGSVITLSNSGVTAGSYTNSNVTVDAKGRVTSISNGSGGGGGDDALIYALTF